MPCRGRTRRQAWGGGSCFLPSWSLTSLCQLPSLTPCSAFHVQCSHTHHTAQFIFCGWQAANAALNCGKSEKCLIAFYIAWLDTNNSWVWMSRRQSRSSQRKKNNNKINPQRLYANNLWSAQKNFLIVFQKALLIKVQDQEVNLSSSRHSSCMHNKRLT